MSFSHDIDQICRAFAETVFDRPAAAKATIVQVRDLPASRVARVHFAHPTDELDVFIKQLHSRTPQEHEKHRALIRKEADLLAALFARFGRADRISVVEPLGCFPDMLALVTRAEDGVTPLDTFIKAHAFASLRARKRHACLLHLAEELGRWLRNLQQITEPLDVDDFLAQRRHHMVGGVKPLVADGSLDQATGTALVKRIESLLPRVRRAGVTGSPFHGDFLPGNVFVRPEGAGAVLLDFADGGVGTVYTDLASMVEWLEFLRYKLLPVRQRIAGVRHAFLNGFSGGHEVQTSLFELLRLEVLIDSLQGHSAIMQDTSRSALLHRSLNRLKYGYLTGRLASVGRAPDT